MHRRSARFVTVGAPLRECIERKMRELGLGVTSRELDASTNTVRKILDESTDASVNVGTLARLCLSLEMSPEEMASMGYPAVAREMGRLRQPLDPITRGARRTMERRD